MDVTSVVEVVSVGAVVVVSVYAAIKQARPRKVRQDIWRFKKGFILIAAGLLFGAFDPPNNRTALVLFLVSLALSGLVGWLRGIWSEVWTGRTEDGATAVNRGTTLTIGMFIALIAVKCGLSIYGQTQHVSDQGALGDILFMIGSMAMVYAQVVFIRARNLLGREAAAVGDSVDASA